MIRLRDYQLEAHAATLMSFVQGKQSVMIVLFTGGGKTEIFVALAKDWPLGRVLIIAPTIELVGQAAKKLAKRTGEPPAIEQADLYSNESSHFRSQFIVGCKSSLCGPKKRYLRLQDIGLVIYDECHLSATAANKAMLDHFRSQGAKILGVTATPIRADGKAMANLFDDCPFQMSIADGTAKGWLVPAVTHCVQLEQLDLSAVGTSGHDFKEADLAKVMEQEKVVFEIAEVTARESAHLKTVVFCASVKEARAVAEVLVDRYQLKADWVCGDTKLCTPERRQQVLRSFTKDPEGVQIVCNVGVLTTGWDFPGLEHIVMARPTKSLALYTQIFGRGTRPLEGVVDFHESTPETRQAAIAASAKPHFKVTDMADNSLKHKLITAADVLGGELGLEVTERAKKKLQESHEAISLDKALLEAKAEIDKEQEARERKKRAAIAAKAKYKRVSADPFDPHQQAEIHERQPAGKKMKFGKYKGQDMAQVPTHYLQWCVEQDFLKWFKGSAFQELKRRKQEQVSR